MSYDPNCYDLAVAFLSDESNATEGDKDKLAQVIQDAIEDFLEYDVRAEAVAMREKGGQ